MNMTFKMKLPTPQEIKAMYPITESLAAQKSKNDKEIQDVLKGESDKILLIIGPCSADREDAVMDYMFKLKEINEQVKDKIVIVPRLYTNKPRTTGAGYKGMLHQPDPNAEPNMLKGVISIRKLHMRVLKETGFSCADEMLYSENHRYLNDLLSYCAVGARSVEDQQHRLTASGIAIPVGMKNPTSGDISVMLNAIHAAQQGHVFIYRGWEVESHGNPLAHVILRGYVDKDGKSYPNYHYEDLISLHKLYDETNFKNPGVIIDANHSNSNKQYLEQIRIIEETIHNMKINKDIRKMVKGFMVESYLEDGNQKIGENIYGKSITDPCLGWEKTKELILSMYQTL